MIFSPKFSSGMVIWTSLVIVGCATGLQEISPRQQEISPPPMVTQPPVQSAATPPAGASIPILPLAPPAAQSPAAARLVAKAQKHAAMAQWDLAQIALDRAYRMSPRDPFITETKARFLLSQKKYAEAESWAQRTLLLLAADQAQAQANVWEIIAAARRAMGRFAEADEAVQKRDEILAKRAAD